MSARHEDRDSGVSRRRFLAGASATVVAGAAVAGTADAAVGSAPGPGTEPNHLPARQHAWQSTLKTDRYGNAIPPRFDRLLFFDVAGSPTPAEALLLESRLRALERRFRWGPGGLLFTAGWGSTYFTQVLGIKSPIPRASRMSSFEKPRIDDYHLCLHLACDDEHRLAAVEAALVHGAPLAGVSGSMALAPALTWRETRTGFTGAGLPAAHQDVHGIPKDRPVSPSAPLFMGFKSSLRKNQATEDAVTIAHGAFAEGTTMAVSYMHLQLDHWYRGLSEEQRVARMYSPETTVAGVKRIRDEATGNPGKITQAIRRFGVIGHSQATALARKSGRPLILRRDFNTVDGGQAGLHFVSVQRSIDDFVVTRNAMNASGAHLENHKITATTNNGINGFIDVRRRANYMIPSRADRSFPLLQGRDEVLG